MSCPPTDGETEAQGNGVAFPRSLHGVRLKSRPVGHEGFLRLHVLVLSLNLEGFEGLG